MEKGFSTVRVEESSPSDSSASESENEKSSSDESEDVSEGEKKEKKNNSKKKNSKNSKSKNMCKRKNNDKSTSSPSSAMGVMTVEELDKDDNGNTRRVKQPVGERESQMPRGSSTIANYYSSEGCGCTGGGKKD